MVDEEIPLDGLMLRCQNVQSGHLNGGIFSSVLASVHQQDAEAGQGQASGKRSTSRTRADDNIVIGGVGYRALGSDGRAERLIETAISCKSSDAQYSYDDERCWAQSMLCRRGFTPQPE